MRRANHSRAIAVMLLAAGFALAPALADARGGFRGGGATSISRGGGGGGAMRGGGSWSGGGSRGGSMSTGASSRGGSGWSGGGSGSRSGASAATRPSNGGGNRVNNGGGRIDGSGNRINTGDVNIGNNTNINVDRGYDWDDNYHPVARGVAFGAAAAVTAAAIGSTMYTLPPACSPYPYGGYSYYSCGGVYYETRYEGDKVVYVVVEQPN